MILVYYIDKPDDHPLHVIACKLGFVRSGWVRPRDLMDRSTGELDRGRIMSMFTAP